jgi:vacuolar protein sorting-associated protein VTA1
VLEQFLDKGKELEYEEPEAAEKARYALWRAAELRKALREGRPPLPPPEPADMGAAMAGAAAGSSGGGAEGDMFAGPSYEAGGGYDEAPQQQQQQQQQQQPPGAPPVSAAGEGCK